MTTSDLIAEALIKFREQILKEVREIVRQEVKKGQKKHFITSPITGTLRER